MHRLLFISNQYYPNVVGGAELITQYLAEELARRGHHVSVVSLSAGAWDSCDEVNGIRVHRLAVANLYAPFKGRHHPLARALWHVADTYNVVMARKLGKILDEERPDWVCANNLAGFSVAVWSAVKQRGIQLSQVLHDYYAICPRATMNEAGVNCERPCTTCKAYGTPRKLASKLPDLVIGVSRFVLERHLALGYFPNARQGVLYNGAPFRAPHTPHLRRPGAPLVLGFIGRVEPVKGIETLLKAVSRLPRGRWHLRVAGRPTDPRFLTYLKETYPLSEVDYLGYVPSEQFYDSVDLVVIPSEWHEPLPGVVYEPLGYGLPVIASRVGGIPEILDGAGCAWTFAPGDTDELTRLLGDVLDGWPDPEGVAARAIARRARFTPQRHADEFLALLADQQREPRPQLEQVDVAPL